MSLEVTVLLSQAVFLLVISDFLPPSSDNFPILGEYLFIYFCWFVYFCLFACFLPYLPKSTNLVGWLAGCRSGQSVDQSVRPSVLQSVSQLVIFCLQKWRFGSNNYIYCRLEFCKVVIKYNFFV